MLYNIKKLIFILLIGSIVIFSNSCTDTNDDKPINGNNSLNTDSIANDIYNSIDENSDKSKENKESESQLTAKEEEYLRELEAKEKKKQESEKFLDKNLTFDDLKKLMPTSIEGFKAIPIITSKTQEDDTTFTVTVKSQFRNDKKQSIVLDLIDYGRGNHIPSKEVYDTPPQDLDGLAYHIELKNAKGYYYWINSKLYGHIAVLVNNRFVVVARLNGFEQDDKLLEKYIKLVKYNDLISK